MTSPYSLEIPRQKGFEWVNIAVSGGRTSAYLLWHMLEAAGGSFDDKVVVSFQNTSKEHPATLEFVARLQEETGVNIEWIEYECLAEGETEFDPPPPEPPIRRYDLLGLDSAYFKDVQSWLSKPLQKPRYRVVNKDTAKKDGEVFDMLIRSQGGPNGGSLPNFRMRFCTRIMKSQACEWNMARHGADKFANAVGFRGDERRRVFRMQDDPKGRWHKGDSKEWASIYSGISTSSNYFPMYHAMVTKKDIIDFWKKMSFDLELPVANLRTQLGNCNGCFNYSESDRYYYASTRPENSWAWLCREHWVPKKRPKEDDAEPFHPFSTKFPMKTVFQNLDTRGDYLLSKKGLLCQADGGECTIDLEDDDAYLLENDFLSKKEDS